MDIISKIKANKWIIISVVLLVMIIGGYIYHDAWVTKVVNDSDKKFQEKQKIIDQLEVEKAGIDIEREEIEQRYKYLKDNPQVKIVKVPEIKYKTIEKIKYVESEKYEEVFDAWGKCDLNLKLCMDHFDDLNLNYNRYRENSEKKEKKMQEQIDVFREARDKLANRHKRVYASLRLSLLGAEAGLYNLNDTMQVYKDNWKNSQGTYETKAIVPGYVFYFVKLEFCLFNRDIIRKDILGI